MDPHCGPRVTRDPQDPPGPAFVREELERVSAERLVKGLPFPPYEGSEFRVLAFRSRCKTELDLRAIKAVMGMDILRCETAEMVRKEVFAHLLVYNLIRGVMAEAADRHGVPPRQLSFQGARQVLEGFRPELAKAAPGQAIALRGEAMKAIAGERVGDRPDRYEPRARKRREKMYPRLQVPRREARRRLARAS